MTVEIYGENRDAKEDVLKRVQQGLVEVMLIGYEMMRT